MGLPVVARLLTLHYSVVELETVRLKYQCSLLDVHGKLNLHACKETAAVDAHHPSGTVPEVPTGVQPVPSPDLGQVMIKTMELDARVRLNAAVMRNCRGFQDEQWCRR